MAKIYQNVSLLPDKLLGRVDSRDGKVYDSTEGQDVVIGQVDYEAGEVYDEDDYLIGWEEDGHIYLSYEDEEGDEDEVESERIGRIDIEDGSLYLFTADGVSYVGSVTDMTSPVEGAAGLLFFFIDDE